MNAETDEKPIRTLLKDISQTVSTSTENARGTVYSKRLNRVCFIASVLALNAVAGVLLAMIWGALDAGTGLQCIGSVGVVLFALLTFRALNGAFEQ